MITIYELMCFIKYNSVLIIYFSNIYKSILIETYIFTLYFHTILIKNVEQKFTLIKYNV